jgi:hypothetical protein
MLPWGNYHGMFEELDRGMKMSDRELSNGKGDRDDY